MRHPNTIPAKFDTIGQASSTLGIPLAIIRRAKADGCAAFRSGRIEVVPLLTFLFAEREAGKLTVPELESRQLELQVDKLAAQNAILRREWTPTALVRQWGAELGTKIKTVVNSLHLISPNLTGLPAVEISAALRKKEDEIMLQLHTLYEAVAAHETADTGELFTDETKVRKPHTFKGNTRPGSSMKSILNPEGTP